MHKIGGTSGTANGEKVLKPVVLSIIEKKMLANISWTGRSAEGETKIPLSAFRNIVKLISSICQTADSTYDEVECVEHLKYKILKYADSKSKKK